MNKSVVLKSQVVALSALVSLVSFSSAEARRIAPPPGLQCSCPVGYTKIGQSCVRTRPPACPVKMTLKVNAQGLIDRCFNPPRHPVQKAYPTHPSGVKKLNGWVLAPKAGIDRWERRLPCVPWKINTPLPIAPND